MSMLVSLLLLGTGFVQQPTAADAALTRQISFTLDRTAPAPTHFEIQLDTHTGKGLYRQSASPSVPAHGPGDAAVLAAEVPVSTDPALLKKLLAASSAIVRRHCESHNTNIAQTGKKTLRLAENGNVAECTYNYSDDDRVNTATALFESLAETLQFGERLTAELRFDRLGLDAEMNNLQDAVKDGRAIALENIAPVLQRITSDDRVLERVRRQAASFLATAGVAPVQPASSTPASLE